MNDDTALVPLPESPSRITPALDKVSAALVAAQAEMPAIPFDSRNPFLNNSYASLGSVISHSRPVLAKHGLAVVQETFTKNGDVCVHTSVIHSSGQAIDGGTLSLPIGDAKGVSVAQAAGSIITYLRRYAWSAVLGLYADEDSDAEPPRPASRKAEYLPEPVSTPPQQKPGANTPPTPGKPVSSQPEAFSDRLDKLYTLLPRLKAMPGEPNRQFVTDFLRAVPIIRPEQEPENWPVKWLPVTMGEANALGPAIDRFKAGEKAVMPYPVHEFEPQKGLPTPWRLHVLLWGSLKGNTLGQLPEDVLNSLWLSYNPEGSGPEARQLREALDAAGVEKGWKRE